MKEKDMSEKELSFFIKGELKSAGQIMNYLDNYVRNEVDTKSDDPHETGKVEACLKISKAISTLINDLYIDEQCNEHDLMLEEGRIDY